MMNKLIFDHYPTEPGTIFFRIKGTLTPTKKVCLTLCQLSAILCFSLVLVGCSANELTAEPSGAVSATDATVDITQPTSPISAPDSPLPTPTSPADRIPKGEPIAASTTATSGAVTGRVFLVNEQEARPVTGIIVALAAVITGDDGVERAAGYDPMTAPRQDIRDDGSFVIENVPPGRYGLILDSVMTAVLLKEPGNLDNSLVITVEAGKVTDMETLIYSFLPLPNLN